MVRIGRFYWLLIPVLIVLAVVIPRQPMPGMRVAPPPAPYSNIEEGLFLGGWEMAPPPGTRAVLNLCESEDPYRAEVHRWDPIPDGAPAPSLGWLRRQVDFVDEQRRAGLPLYIHCHAGISRGGLVVVAHLMRRHRWRRDQAIEFVREQRPINPNPAFMELLLEWERTIAQE